METKQRTLSIYELGERLGYVERAFNLDKEEAIYKSALLINRMLSNMDVNDVQNFPKAAVLGNLMGSVLENKLHSFLTEIYESEKVRNIELGMLVDDESERTLKVLDRLVVAANN